VAEISHMKLSAVVEIQFANKKLLKNKDLNATSKLQIYKCIIRPTVTYGCETWATTVTEQN
jgi:hypothetical protein